MGMVAVLTGCCNHATASTAPWANEYRLFPAPLQLDYICLQYQLIAANIHCDCPLCIALHTPICTASFRRHTLHTQTHRRTFLLTQKVKTPAREPSIAMTATVTSRRRYGSCTSRSVTLCVRTVCKFTYTRSHTGLYANSIHTVYRYTRA